VAVVACAIFKKRKNKNPKKPKNPKLDIVIYNEKF